MPESKWEKHKKQDRLDMVEGDEILILIIGIFTFGSLEILQVNKSLFEEFKIIFIIGVILWYWLKIRHYEKKIIDKEKDIYNVYYDNIRPAPQELIDLRTEKERKPMIYDLKQLENKRKFLVDKFVVINLILIVLIELFIKK